MAEVKVSRSQWIPQLLLCPYRHELNSAGTGCAQDCPACRWKERTNDAPWNRQNNGELNDCCYRRTPVKPRLQVVGPHSSPRAIR